MVVVKLNSGDLFLYNPVKVRNETGMVWAQLENWKDGGKKFYCKKKGILSGQNCQNNDKVLKDLNTLANFGAMSFVLQSFVLQ